MNKQTTPPLKRTTAAMLLTIVLAGSFASGWAWWKGTWPFKEHSSPMVEEKVDLMADVKYITPSVIFDRYADFRFPLETTEGAGGVPLVHQQTYKTQVHSPDGTLQLLPEQPEWLRGEKVLSLPPFLISPSGGKYALDIKKEMLKTKTLRQEIIHDMTATIQENGFRLLPYSRPAKKNVKEEDEFSDRKATQETVSEISCATITARVLTYKAGPKVWFRIERVDIRGYLRADLDKPTLVQTVFASSGGRYGLSNFVVDEEYAPQAIKSILGETVKHAFSQRWQKVKPPDSLRELDTNPEDY